MKKTIIISALCILIPSMVHAGNWTKEDTIREVVYQVFHYADMMQTLDIANDPTIYELNPVMGKYPSRETVYTYFIATSLAHAGISYILPPKWREAWQYITIGIEGATVVRNFRLGIGMRF